MRIAPKTIKMAPTNYIFVIAWFRKMTESRMWIRAPALYKATTMPATPIVIVKDPITIPV